MVGLYSGNPVLHTIFAFANKLAAVVPRNFSLLSGQNHGSSHFDEILTHIILAFTP
ncbi:hypothetical protein SAMN06296036_102166 [Pseudobacteriovorax antillogorgiicola]|uniref:Uncharacterized protein n=1 Tax=Pseudobacteriovorax antillogorgiicola TaxID=1513793 RepID=A0A1Y6B6R6_9BACT|nr:hypothetical protein EDD56_102277 [Pseudobacteriovorax antillogorgiicola]SME94997.1 hypothetical protein SAMN06296036_102166 [Pseudobacteriovorax antillogorgiicola]